MNPKTFTIIARLAFVAAVLFAAAKQAGCEEPEKSRLYKALGFALVGTGVSDLWSTELAMQRPGAYETNPLGPNVGTRLAVKVGATGLIVAGSDHIHSKGHTRVALWLRIATVAAWGAATAHNLRVAR